MLRFLLFISFLFFHFSSFSFTSEGAQVATPPKTLVILGDSLTEGYGVARDQAYPAILEKKISEAKLGWKVVNSGVSGSTTASAISRAKWLLKSKPQMVLLCLGANDGLRGIKIEDSKKNLAAAIEFLKQNNVTVVLGGLFLPPNYGKDYTTKFRSLYEETAKREKIILIPFLLEGVGGHSEYNLADGIHPNEKGHQIIAETVFKSIRSLL